MLQIGQKVYSGLHGGRDGVVYAIHGTQRPDTVGTIAGIVSCGGNAEFDIVFSNGNYTKGLPESILYGVQWKIYPDVVPAEQVRAMLDFAASETARKEAEAKKASEDFMAAAEALKADPRYSALQQTGNGASYNKLVAINLRRELKAAFPGVKFSVTCRGFDSVKVAWRDGPTKAAVTAITDKYSGGYFDGMEDIYRSTQSPWTTVFGSAKYINTVRSYSVEAMKSVAEAVRVDHGWPPVEVSTSYDGSAYLGAGVNYRQEREIYAALEGR